MTFIAMPSATLHSSRKATRRACGALSSFSMVLGSAQCDATLAALRVAASSDTCTLKVCCMLCVSKDLVNVVRQSDGAGSVHASPTVQTLTTAPSAHDPAQLNVRRKCRL